jgi:anti-anti-sigma regulatory factor
VHRGALAGVVYLENRAARGAFGKERVEVLSLLSSQAAIAVENALLVADVRFRTNELAQANEELVRELAERERTEAERAHLQQGIIAMQKARLAELRTPFIPVTSDVMVMPLVGTLDGARAEEALEVALSGTASRGARVVILDITGVKGVDENVALTLVRMVDALRLLGAEAIVTGVRGDVARTLVELDAGFGEKVVTKSTLEAGVRRALAARSRRG